MSSNLPVSQSKSLVSSPQPLFPQHQSVCKPCLHLLVMRGAEEQAAALVLVLQELFYDELTVCAVQARSRFIGQKDGRLPEDCTKESDTLRFSAGERVRLSWCVLRKSDRGKQALGLFPGECLSRNRCGETEILEDGEIGHEHGLLENAADLFRTEITFLFLPQLCDVLPIYHDLARCRREQAAHRMEKRRFPAPEGRSAPMVHS